jgi:hypothetical protein
MQTPGIERVFLVPALAREASAIVLVGFALRRRNHSISPTALPHAELD